MRPTVIAYRLLQPVKERRTSTTSGFDLRSVTRAATLFTFCGRGDSPLREGRGRRTANHVLWSGHPELAFSREGFANSIVCSVPSTSTTSCDAAYRWPWQRGPRDRVKDSRAVDALANAPPQLPSCTHRHRCARREGWRVLTSECSHRSRPPRRRPSAKKNSCSETRVLSTAGGPPCAHRSLDVTANGSVSPHAAPSEGALRSASATVPSGDDEPRLLMPWLGRASAFFTYRAASP